MEGLKKFWQSWRKFGQFIGDWIARLVLSLFYFTIYVPFALVFRFSRDPLAIKNWRNPHWLERQTLDRTMADARRLS